MSQPSDPADAVTQLQDQIVKVCAGFFNFVGALQRDAPPTTVAGEGIIRPQQQPYNVEEQTKVMASELLQGFQDLESIIKRLPEGAEGEDAQLAAAAELQQHDTAGLEALQIELKSAKEKLEKMQRAHGVAADALLLQPPLPPPPQSEN